MGPQVWRGVRATLPIALSVMPFGIAFGAIAGDQMAFGQALLMSLTVFAGTAQFIAASMLSQGAAYLSILITGILINARLVLLSVALVPQLRDLPRPLYPLAAQLLTDESFAVSMAEFRQRASDARFFLGSGLAIFGVWQIATVLGLTFGAHLPGWLGLAYALPASLISLLFLLVRGRRAALVALLAVGISLAVIPWVTQTWSTVVATCVAATLGTVAKRWQSRC